MTQTEYSKIVDDTHEVARELANQLFTRLMQNPLPPDGVVELFEIFLFSGMIGALISYKVLDKSITPFPYSSDLDLIKALSDQKFDHETLIKIAVELNRRVTEEQNENRVQTSTPTV